MRGLTLFFSVNLCVLINAVLVSAADLVQCEEISDKNCLVVWSNQFKGNTSFGTEFIYMGYSPKSEMAYARKFDLEALVASAERIPADLKPELLPLVHELKSHLEKKNEEKAWLRHLAIIEYRIGSVIADTAEKRTFKRRPELKLKGKKEDDKTFVDRQELNFDFLDLQSEILETKYARHPNWLRVEAAYKDVKNEMMALIQTFPLDKVVRDRLSQKVKSVKLTLPYTDRRRLGADESCTMDESNAFYYAAHNKFTVCAGYFNTLQSLGRMYFTIAHELAHAIDPGNYSYEFFQKTKVANLVELVSGKNAQISCEQWQKLKAQAFAEPAAFFVLPEKIFQLSECLVDRKDLEPLTLDAIKEPCQARSFRKFSSYATYNYFTQLVSPQIYKYENLIDNEMFLRPDRLSATDEQYLFLPNNYAWFDANAIFVQEFRCQKGAGAEFKLNDAKDIAKSPAFESALSETRRLLTLYLQQRSSFEGRENSDLQDYNLSRPSGEFWADWVAKKVFSSLLKKATASDRKNMILAANASNCEKAGLGSVAPNLVKVEKKFSNEEHPESRSRRLFIFTEYVAQVMECSRGKEILTRDQQCEM